MQAAIYLRSSKDRSDVSIDAQRRELESLAAEKGLTIVQEFSDAVESGKDDNRPGFRDLLSTLKKKDRPWSFLLALDTSRIARNQYLAHALHYECDKRNIKILYSKMPETGSVVDVVIRAVMQAFDQLHSLMSKEKGLTGMAENVKQGFRAGGLAPLGYALEHIETGAIRDGLPVTKSRLVVSDAAPKVKEYFRMRSLGFSRPRAAEEAGIIGINQSTLVGMEWNALTYAGHTVWNVHNERLSDGGYKSGTKRRPRSEWVINENTHEGLITPAVAESIISNLENSPHSKVVKRVGRYLLSGILFNAEGKPYHGCDGVYYRAGKGKRIGRDYIENAILGEVARTVKSKDFVDDLLQSTKKTPEPEDDGLKALKAQLSAVNSQISKFMDIVAEAESPRPWLEKVERLEKEREYLVGQVEKSEFDHKAINMLREISAEDIRRLLDGVYGGYDELDFNSKLDFMNSLVEKVVLNETPRLSCEIHYRIVSGEIMASPRGFEPRSPP